VPGRPRGSGAGWGRHTEHDRLPERQRLALAGRVLQGLSHEELARALGASPPASKALIARARSTLHAGRARRGEGLPTLAA